MTDRQKMVEKIDKILEKHIIVGKIADRITMDVSVRIAIAEALCDAGCRFEDGFECRACIEGYSKNKVKAIDYSKWLQGGR